MPVLAVKLLAPVWSILKLAIPIPIVLMLAVAVWTHLDKTSAIRRSVDSALEQMVNGAEKAALVARLDQERRLRQAAEAAIAGYTRALAEIDRREAIAAEQREQEIADYETKLAAAGRSCLLDGADIDWLRR